MPEHDHFDGYNYPSFTRAVVAAKEQFKNIARAGTAAPDFELATPEGERVCLSQFRGRKYVVLEFGAIT